MRLLTQPELDSAVFDDYVGKDNKSAIVQQVDQKLKEMQKKITDENLTAFGPGEDRKQKEIRIEEQIRQRNRSAPRCGAT